MTLDSCPACKGELNSVPGNPDAVVCSNCGRVDPKQTEADTHETQFSEQKADDTNDIQPTTRGWKQNVTVTDSSDENIVEILSLIDRYVEATALPQKVRLRAAEILVSAWEGGLFEGRRKEPLAAAGVYAAGRECGHPRPLTTVSNTTEVSESKLNDDYRLLMSKLDLEIPITVAEDYAPYIGRELSLPESVVHEAVATLKKEVDCSGNPAGIAASVLYLLASNDSSITLKQAGAAAGVSKETVWRHTKSLRESGAKIS